MRKRTIALLLTLALVSACLAGCGGEGPAAGSTADYDGTWYLANSGVACCFNDGKIYRDDRTVHEGQVLAGIYSAAGDHLEANLTGVGGVNKIRDLYLVDSAEGEYLCETADGSGTVYFYRDPLTVLSRMEKQETAEPTPEPEPQEDSSSDPEVLLLEPAADDDPSSLPEDKTIPADPEQEVPVPADEPMEDTKTSGTVWVPKSGSKYHSDPTCSGMKNPRKVSLSEAKSKGYTPCKRCY